MEYVTGGWRAHADLDALMSGGSVLTKQNKTVAQVLVPEDVDVCHRSGTCSVIFMSFISCAYKVIMMMLLLLLFFLDINMMVTAVMVRSMILISSSGSGSHVDHVHFHVAICTMDGISVRVPVVFTTSVILLDVPIAFMNGTVIFVTISVAVTIMNVLVLVMNTLILAFGPVVVTDDIGQRDRHLITKPSCR